MESFGSRIRDELLGAEPFSGPAEAHVMVEAWRQHYNHHRPHSALGMITPARLAAGYRAYLEALDEHPSPLYGVKLGPAGTTTTTTNNQLSHQVDR